MSLRLLMLLVFLYSSDLHLKLINPTYSIVLPASAVSHTTGPSTSRLRRARGNPSSRKLKFPRFSRQRNSLKQLTSTRSVLMHQAWPKRGSLRGTIGLRNYEIPPPPPPRFSYLPNSRPAGQFPSGISETAQKFLRLFFLWIFKDLMGSSLFHDNSIAHEDHMLRHISGEGHLMCDD